MSPVLSVPLLLYWLGVSLLGFHNLSVAPAWTVSDIAFVACAVTSLVVAAKAPRAAQLRWPVAIICGSVIYAIGGVLTAAIVPAGAASILVVARFMYLTVIWFTVGTWVVHTLSELVTTVTIWVLSAGASGAGSFVQLFALKQGIALPGTPTVQYFGRMTGFMDHPNSLGSLCAIALPPALMLVTLRTTTWRRRVTALAALGGIIAGVVLSGSVSGLLAALGGSLTWVILTRPNRRTITVGALILLAVAGVVNLQQSSTGLSPMVRIQTVIGVDSSSPDSATGLSRLDLIGQSWDIISRDPVFGVGLDPESTAGAFSGGFAVHNILLFAWIGGGVFAFVGMLVVLAAIAKACYQVVVPREDSLGFKLGVSLTCSYAAFVVYVMSAPVITDRYLWIPAPLILILAAVRSSSSNAEQSHDITAKLSDVSH